MECAYTAGKRGLHHHTVALYRVTTCCSFELRRKMVLTEYTQRSLRAKPQLVRDYIMLELVRF